MTDAGGVKRIRVTWHNDGARYTVSEPSWDGGEVVMASDYDALTAALETAQRKREEVKASIPLERVRSRLMGLEDGAQAYSADNFERLESDLATERQARETAEAALKRMREPVSDDEWKVMKFEYRVNDGPTMQAIGIRQVNDLLAARHAAQQQPASEPGTGEAK